MKLRKNSLTIKIWVYLIAFSILILGFLWIFQILFLDTYYQLSKTRELDKVVKTIVESYEKSNFLTTIEDLSYDSGICIEVIQNNNRLFTSMTFNRGCILDKDSLIYRQNFINSNKNSQTYEMINPRFNNKTLIHANKLDMDLYIFTSVSLQPLDSTINILKSQLIIVTVVVLLLSFAIAYFISKRVSRPIIKLNNIAKGMAKGDNTVFHMEEDIYEINELTETLNKVSDELSKTEELRRELLANVSHDLKTPLTMIKAYAEMVRDLTYNDKTKREENLKVIIEESDRLNLLVNDILELSKIQAKAIPLQYESFDINLLIKEIIKKFACLIQTEQYQIIFNESGETFVLADRLRIGQVIYNLINNAVNYTGNDKKVIINIEKKGSDVIVKVSDTGKGIDEKDIDLIWDKYYKIDKKYKRELNGSGIGLSIVKNILINHKFPYGVESEINKGTTFWFAIKDNKIK